MKSCPIFISSSDSYSDLWPVFFYLFKINWPQYNGDIYLNTEEKIFQSEGLNIICTQVGKHKAFGTTFRRGLDMIKSDKILLIMIDYLFMGKVKQEKLDEYYNFFIEKKIDSLCLITQDYPNTTKSVNSELKLVLPPAPHIMFSYQIAFWEKSILYQMALPHESPWTSEWYGTLRAEKMKLKLAFVSNIENNPISYNPAGCLHKGKWLEDAILYLKSINYYVDFSKRGLYQEPALTISKRIKSRWKRMKHGLMGSYWDLVNRTK